MNDRKDVPSVSEGLQETAGRLLDYCEKNGWAGYDPYDALNSRVFAHTPFNRSKVFRIAFTQIMKRLPINIRPMLVVRKDQNPKAIAIFLMAFLKYGRLGGVNNDYYINMMVERLSSLRSQDTPYSCWGYSFPWQSRQRLVPKGAPNLVCTVFVANALLDAYEKNGDAHVLAMAISAAEYILNELYWTEDDLIAGFSYPVPGVRTRVHNANFLGAALFCRIFKYKRDERLLETALKVARYSASRQHDDGSWDYGEHHKQRWIDNFHTGYNLCALRTIGRCAGTAEFESHIRRGFSFYRKNFFRTDCAPKYFHNRIYPIDIHSVAQSIITLQELQEYDDSSIGLAHSVFKWAMKHMWDAEGYFYYQVYPFYKGKISYMRWSQAWMLLALATLLRNWSEPLYNDVYPASRKSSGGVGN